MSDLDSLLENYCKCTDCSCADCNCANNLEAKVRARLRTHQAPLYSSAFPKGTFRPAAITAGFILGMASIGLTTGPALSAQEGGLTIFSPYSPDLPSTLLGRKS